MQNENKKHFDVRAIIRNHFKPNKTTKYKQQIVAYLDMLGFSAQLKRQENLQDLHVQVSLFQSIFKSDQHYKSGGSVMQISDGIVISSDVKNMLALDNFLRGIMKGVETLMYLQIPIRGAITYGANFQKNSVLISPAFVDAYRLEQSVAKYPRVLIDLSVVELQRRLQKGKLDALKLPLNKYSKADVDGYRFIDYLKFRTFERNDIQLSEDLPFTNPQDELRLSLRLHRENIESAYEKATSDSIRAKYVWLAHYYNDSIKSLFGFNSQQIAEHQIHSKYLELVDALNPNFTR